VIQLNDIAITAGDFQLSEINLTIPTGKYGILMGRTGSGKTTLLEAIAGLSQVTAGEILLGDTDVTAMKPSQRNIGYVPQDGALFNTMTVRDHLSFALTIRKTPQAETDQRVTELAEMLEITYLLDRRPFKLSGGERQRVALGRALSFRPTTLLLDEPLSALDEQTRDQICNLLDTIQAHTGVTVLHITHSLAEAERLADCLFRLEGKILPDSDFQGKAATAPAISPDTS